MTKNLTNQKFGKLTTKYLAPSILINNTNKSAWYCECECGNMCIATTEDLVSGKITSCGCDFNLANKQFGSLTVKPFSEKVDGITSWLCECKCGTLKIIESSKLLNGEVISCGCGSDKVVTTQSTTTKSKKKTNKFDLSGEYGIGYSINDNVEFYFDKEDFDKIKDYKWYHNENNISANINYKKVMLRNLLVATDKDHCLTYKNSNRLDNRKSNLIPITYSQVRRKTNLKNNTSGVHGVYFRKNDSKWAAELMCNGERHVKIFKTKEEAIAQRKAWEIEFSNK